jgi:hypothetical protein
MPLSIVVFEQDNVANNCHQMEGVLLGAHVVVVQLHGGHKTRNPNATPNYPKNKKSGGKFRNPLNLGKSGVYIGEPNNPLNPNLDQI